MDISCKFNLEAKEKYAELVLQCVLEGVVAPPQGMIRDFLDGCTAHSSVDQYLILCAVFVARINDPDNFLLSFYREAIEDANSFAKEYIETYKFNTEKDLEATLAQKERHQRAAQSFADRAEEIGCTLSLVTSHLRRNNP